MRRRTLRPDGPATLIEGAVLGRCASSDLVVEIVGGPPRALLRVLLDRRDHGTILLDASGAGLLILAGDQASLPIEIRHDDVVLLRGRTPSTTPGRRSAPTFAEGESR